MAARAALMIVATLVSAPVQARPSSSVGTGLHALTYGRLRRDISLRGQTVNQLDRQRLLELIARVDLSRCFAKWACDILARDEADRAAEERDLAALFTEEDLDSASVSSDPDSPQTVYLAAAARGHASGGNRSVCEVPSCHAEPRDMLKMLREMEGLGDLVREAGRKQRERAPLVVFGVEEGEPVRGVQGGQSVLFAVEEGVGHQEPQTVLFGVVEGEKGAEKTKKEGKKGAEESAQEKDKEQPTEARKNKKAVEEKSQKNGKEGPEERDMEGENEMTKGEAEMSGEDEMSSVSTPAVKDSAGMEKKVDVEKEAEKMELKMKENGSSEDKLKKRTLLVRP